MRDGFSNQALEIIAARFRVLAEPIRLRVLELLRNGEMSVSALTAELRTSQPNVSKHLRILTDSGVLRREQRGNTVYYSIEDESIFQICELVCDSVGERFRRQADLFVTTLSREL